MVVHHMLKSLSPKPTDDWVYHMSVKYFRSNQRFYCNSVTTTMDNQHIFTTWKLEPTDHPRCGGCTHTPSSPVIQNVKKDHPLERHWFTMTHHWNSPWSNSINSILHRYRKLPSCCGLVHRERQPPTDWSPHLLRRCEPIDGCPYPGAPTIEGHQSHEPVYWSTYSSTSLWTSLIIIHYDTLFPIIHHHELIIITPINHYEPSNILYFCWSLSPTINLAIFTMYDFEQHYASLTRHQPSWTTQQ